MKKLIALLLALVMVLSLAACAKDDADDDDEKEEKTEQTAKPEKDDKEDKDDEKDDAPASKLDYSVLVDEFEDFLSDPSLKGFSTLAGGSLAGDAMNDYLAASLDTMGMSEDDFISQTKDSLGNVKVADSTAEALSADEIADYQSDLEDAVAEYQSMIDDINAMTEEEWQELADQLSVSLDEAKQIGADMVDSLTDLVDALDGVEIEDAQRVVITLENEEGETDEQEFYFFTADGKWFSDGLLSM